MSVSKPYYRIWRPVKGYDWGKVAFPLGDDKEPKPTLDYLYDNRFANQQEKKSLITATRIIMRDLNEIFDFVEPSNDNTSVYIDADECLVETEMFTIHAPHFPENEKYDFIWEILANEADVFQKYNF